jgi:hypothetical protein
VEADRHIYVYLYICMSGYDNQEQNASLSESEHDTPIHAWYLEF